tara:strand:+ start:4371 stop:4532 length:162 start_codon:yes stop_codon:yes gene_type:complete
VINGVEEDLDEYVEGVGEEGDGGRVEVKVEYILGHLHLQGVIGRMIMYLLMMI